MSGYALTPAADADLAELWQYVAQASGPSAADRVEAELHSTMLLLATSPGIGHVRTDLADETLKVLAVHNYLIIYRPTTRPIQVIRVLHGARDIAANFGPG